MAVDEELERIINSDATLRALFTPTREPRYRYWQSPDGTMFLYTTEKFADGKYGSAIMQPYGPGSRSGKKNVTRWKPVREVHHRTRRAARDRARKLYEQHVAR